MSYHPCVSGCGHFLAPQDGHDRCLTCLGIQHAEEAFVDVHVLLVGTWPSRSCIKDSVMSNMAEFLCLCRDPVFVPAPGAALRLVESEVIWGSWWGLPQVQLLTPQALRSRWSCRRSAGPSAGQSAPCVSFGAPSDDQMSIAASEGEPSLSGDDDPAALPPSGVVALSEPDPEMTAMLSRAAENIGLVWNPPPRPDPSSLDLWFLGGGHAGSQRPPRCHSSRKCMRSSQDRGRHLLLPETNLVAPPPSLPSMVGPLWGTRTSPWWRGLWPCNCGHVSNSRYHSVGWPVSPLTGL